MARAHRFLRKTTIGAQSSSQTTRAIPGRSLAMPTLRLRDARDFTETLANAATAAEQGARFQRYSCPRRDCGLGCHRSLCFRCAFRPVREVPTHTQSCWIAGNLQFQSSGFVLHRPRFRRSRSMVVGVSHVGTLSKGRRYFRAALLLSTHSGAIVSGGVWMSSMTLRLSTATIKTVKYRKKTEELIN